MQNAQVVKLMYVFFLKCSFFCIYSALLECIVLAVKLVDIFVYVLWVQHTFSVLVSSVDHHTEKVKSHLPFAVC